MRRDNKNVANHNSEFTIRENQENRINIFSIDKKIIKL